MTDPGTNPAPRDGSPEEIELLLPWYVNGTLEPSDVAKVEAHLKRHPETQAQLATLREDMDESIRANEAIAGPSGAALDRLMNQIEAEPQARYRIANVRRGLMQSIDEFLRSLSPGRLGWAAMAAAAVIMLQAGIVGTMMLKPTSRGGANYTTASGGEQLKGTFVLMQFKPAASVATISSFLTKQGAEIVGGPKPGGLFRVRVSAEELDDATRQALIAKLSSNSELVNLVLPSQ